jgi:hypothetical protein
LEEGFGMRANKAKTKILLLFWHYSAKKTISRAEPPSLCYAWQIVPKLLKAEIMSSIREALDKFPRVELFRSPSPLQHLEYLSKALNVNFYIKRHDLTELTLGGDKARKLEYELADVAVL